MNPAYDAGPLPLRFAARHIETFRNVSYDHNPLHCDPVYTRNTQFGEPIIFGIAVVLSTLGRVFCSRRLSIKHVKVVFVRPVFPERDYTIETTLKAGLYSIAVRGAGGVHVRIKLALGADRPASARDEPPTSEAAAPRVTDRAPSGMQYSLNWREYANFCRCFELVPGALSPGQMNALLWSSYFVGMVAPGVQALFAALELTFDNSHETASTIVLGQLEYEYDDRYALVQVAGVGTGITRLALTAMSRPLPVRYSMHDITRALAENETVQAHARTQFREKRIFVTGGSRGLGSVFARGLALLGAAVVAGCRYPSDDADALAADLAALNPASGVLVADLPDAVSFRHAVETTAAGGRFDGVVCTASPIIRPAPFADMEGHDIVDFVGRSLSLVVTPLQAFLPLMEPGGRIVVVSSAYAATAEAGYGPYVAAKRAIEGLAEVLAKEYPAIELVILRPGRFLSDQTNNVLDRGSLPTAIDVFCAFLRRLLDPPRRAAPNLWYCAL